MSDDLFAGDVPAPAPKPTKAPKFYPIYAGARRATCTGPTCGGVVYWDARYKFPISADVVGGIHPTRDTDGEGVSHFTNCPDVRSFSGRGKK